VQRLAQHAFTELLNNAVDHSGGTAVTVSLRQTALHLQLLVSDNGCGVFKRIEESFGIDDPQLAMFELSKGKLTSQPERHCGHGLYFSSRLADVFDLHANRAAFQYRNFGGRPWRATRPGPHTGTSIYLAIALDTPRTLDEVLRSQGSAALAYGFQRTQVPLHLLAGGDTLASRADAKRVASRLQAFARAEIDFAGIEYVGHGFADELFRVFRREHPEVELVPLAMNAQVSAMLATVNA
jgi:anti-sigma regulatory factor (Ser/Thr protein kinase)